MHRLYCHAIWATRERHSIIDAGLAAFLCRFLRAVARQERAHILEIGMVRTHVHVLARVHPTTILPRLLQRWKGGSAVIAGKERRSTEGHDLRWAKGYSLHTVSARQLRAVREYLRGQPQRHPNERIVGWPGDAPEYEHAGAEQWVGEERAQLRP
jgi:REP element-mobilizing transposase RayT